jgi:hypothetical protein
MHPNSLHAVTAAEEVSAESAAALEKVRAAFADLPADVHLDRNESGHEWIHIAHQWIEFDQGVEPGFLTDASLALLLKKFPRSRAAKE